MIFQCLLSVIVSADAASCYLQPSVFSKQSQHCSLLCLEDILLADSHSVKVNICLDMDRKNEDYCLLRCDAVCDYNSLLACFFCLDDGSGRYLRNVYAWCLWNEISGYCCFVAVFWGCDAL